MKEHCNIITCIGSVGGVIRKPFGSTEQLKLESALAGTNTDQLPYLTDLVHICQSSEKNVKITMLN